MFGKLFAKILALRGKVQEGACLSSNAKVVEIDTRAVPTGVRTSQDLVSNLESLMEEGNYSACFDLGQLYYLGDKGIQKNIHRAMEFFKEAADHGVAEAAYQLGRIYEVGDEDGLPANQVLSFEW